MDIEQFYEENEARRSSAEIEFGADWSDASGRRYELSWVESTGELYLMLGPVARVNEDPLFGDVINYEDDIASFSVRVLAVISDGSDVETRLDGWSEAMAQPNSLAWLYERLGVTPS